MFGISPIILILLPLFFQLIFGRKAINETIKLRLRTISLISLFLQIVLSILSYWIASYNFRESLGQQPYRCGMGILSIIVISLLFTFILIIVMIVQFLMTKSGEKQLF
jgi:hypothetical protein